MANFYYQRKDYARAIDVFENVLDEHPDANFLDVILFHKAEKTGEMNWGRINPISQYVLIFIAFTFTWLMGLMGYVRAGLRQHWHVFGVIRDTSVDAFTPTLGFATKIVSLTVLIFFALLGVVFWLTSLSGRPDWQPNGDKAEQS